MTTFDSGNFHGLPVDVCQVLPRLYRCHRRIDGSKDWRHVNSKELGRKEFQPVPSLFEVDDNASVDFPAELVVGSCQLDESLDEKPAIFRTILPDCLPCLVCLPEGSRIEQQNSPIQLRLLRRCQVKCR